MLKLGSFLIAALILLGGSTIVQAAPLVQLHHTQAQFNEILSSKTSTVMLLTSLACADTSCVQLEQWLEQEAEKHPELRIVKGDAGEWGIEPGRLPFVYVVPARTSVFGLSNYKPKTIVEVEKLITSIISP